MNSTVDGILAALFALMIVVVILDASRIWFKVIRTREPLPTTEPSTSRRRSAPPAGLFATAEERAVLAGGDGRFMRDERETSRTGGGP